MLLVFGGHTPFNDGVVYSYIYSFHMPLFFWLSGYLATVEKTSSYRTFILRKAEHLLLPYVLFFTIASLYWFFLYAWVLSGHPNPIPYPQLFMALLLSGERLCMLPAFSLWFLPCLFIVVNCFYFVRKLKRDWLIAFALLVVACLTVTIQHLVPGRPPHHVNVVPAALVFMGLGYLCRRYEHHIRVTPLVFAALLAISLYLWGPNWSANISQIKLARSYFVSAFCSILVYLEIAKRAKDSGLLRYIGRHSLFFYGLHEVTINAIHNLGMFVWLKGLLGLDPGSQGVSSHYLSILFTIAILLVLSRTYESFMRVAVWLARHARRAVGSVGGALARA